MTRALKGNKNGLGRIITGRHGQDEAVSCAEGKATTTASMALWPEVEDGRVWVCVERCADGS